jgi:Cyclic nucleotide-binding domain
MLVSNDARPGSDPRTGWSRLAVSFSLARLSFQLKVEREQGADVLQSSVPPAADPSAETKRWPVRPSRFFVPLGRRPNGRPNSTLRSAEVPDVTRERERAQTGSFWNNLTASEQVTFKALSEPRTFARGARLMREGEKADYVVVILDGRVKISVGDGNSRRVIARRGPGEIVGERAIVQIAVRSATVTALEMVRALVMTTENFAIFVSDHPDVLTVIEGRIYERLVEEPAGDDDGAGGSADAQDGETPGSAANTPGVLTLHGENCTIVGIDVAGFGSIDRDDGHRRLIRQTMAGLRDTLTARWIPCSCEDRGDGLLLVVPPAIPTAQVLEYLPFALLIALKRHNGTFNHAAQIQLRVALDVGPVTSDELGVSGRAIINVARLLDTAELKDAMKANHALLGLIVSDFIYELSVRHTSVLESFGAFRPVDVSVKEMETQAWVQFVDPVVPVPPEQVA